VRQIALFAWIPLLTAWAGNGEASKLCLIALAAFFPVARIVLPAAAPTIAAGLRIALAAAWIGTIGAEYMIENGRGLGMLLEAAREASRMDEVVIGIAVLALTGLALDRLLRLATGRWVSAS
jgi:sulfonate transport system permease protein